MPDGFSPFSKNKIRTLKLTFHDEGLKELTGDELDAYHVLRELCNLPQIEAFQFTLGKFPYIELLDRGNDTISIHTHYEDGLGMRWMEKKRQCLHSPHFDFEVTSESGLALGAHKECEHDIFVTASVFLLERRGSNMENIRLPSEALKIVGLFLRCRDMWIYHEEKTWKEVTSKQEFYWILMLSQLPSIGRQQHVCHKISGFKGVLSGLSDSLLNRCNTLIQIRDELAKQFYGDNDESDILYHFNYFFLLITGALDTQARIVHDVYSFSATKHSANFNNPTGKFYKELKSKNLAVYDVVSSPYNRALIRLLHSLRNIIHSTEHDSNAADYDSVLEIVLSPDISEDVWSFGQEIGCDESKGLSRHEYKESGPWHPGWVNRVDVCIEPYNFVNFILKRTFLLIDDIVRETRVEEVYNISPQHDPKQNDCDFKVKRFRMLGW
jgi:hypothetical protein